MGLEENEDAVIYEQFFEDQTFADLKELVYGAARKSPVAYRLAPKLEPEEGVEGDIDRLIDLGDFDFISLLTADRRQ